MVIFIGRQALKSIWRALNFDKSLLFVSISRMVAELDRTGIRMPAFELDLLLPNKERECSREIKKVASRMARKLDDLLREKVFCGDLTLYEFDEEILYQFFKDPDVADKFLYSLSINADNQFNIFSVRIESNRYKADQIDLVIRGHGPSGTDLESADDTFLISEFARIKPRLKFKRLVIVMPFSHAMDVEVITPEKVRLKAALISEATLGLLSDFKPL